MPNYDVRPCKNRIMQDSAPSQRAKATQNFLCDNTPDFISSQEWTPHSPDLNLLNYSVWDILQELVYEGTVYESQRSSEFYQKQMAWCRWPDSQKSYIAKEKAFSSCGKAEWRTYLAHFLLISWLIQITVMFWCSLRTANNINDELLVNIVLWHVTLFPLYNG